jgi:hypothetical protein
VREPVDEREAALEALKAKRDFNMHLGAYVIVNAMLPVWLMLFWGVGLAFHGWSAFFQKPISESDVTRKLDRK